MDEKKLESIRALAKLDFTEHLEPDLAAYLRESSLESQQDNADSAPPTARYAGYSSLLKAATSDSFDDVDIGLVGVPFDLGVTNRPGPRFGPKQIREMSYLAVNGPPVHETSLIAPFNLCNVADVGDVGFRSNYDINMGVEDMVTYYTRLVNAGVMPLSAGGDHSISYPILKALGQKQAVGLVQIDAHADTLGPMDGSRFHHGGPFLNAAIDGVLDPQRTVQIGIRGTAAILWGFSHASGMRVIDMTEFDSMGVQAVIDEARKVIGDGPTYVTIDVDGIDPAFTPGTGTPEVGGLTPLQVQQIIRGLRGANLIGGDVVEVSPPYDPSGNTAIVAGRMMWELLCVLSESRSK